MEPPRRRSDSPTRGCHLHELLRAHRLYPHVAHTHLYAVWPYRPALTRAALLTHSLTHDTLLSWSSSLFSVQHGQHWRVRYLPALSALTVSSASSRLRGAVTFVSHPRAFACRTSPRLVATFTNNAPDPYPPSSLRHLTMPPGRASAGRTSRSPSPSQPAAAAGVPVSCERVVSNTAAHLLARPEAAQTRCLVDTYAVGELDPSLGWRTGHSVVLSADHRVLCVVGGLRAGEVNVNESDVVHMEPSQDDESDAESVATPLAPPPPPPPPSKRAQSPVPPAASRVKSSPARTTPEATREAPQRTPAKPSSAAAPRMGAGGKTRQTTVPGAAGSTTTPPPPPAIASGATPATAAAAAAVPAVPAEWRTRLPVVECLDLEKKVWFVPLGEQRRAAAVSAAQTQTASPNASPEEVVSRGGGIRWPAQSVAAVVWEGRAPKSPADVASATGTPTPAQALVPLTPSPPPAPALTGAAGDARTGGVASRRPPTKPLKSAAVPEPAADTAPPPPTTMSTAKEKARERRLQQQAAKAAEQEANAEAARARRLDARRRRDAQWAVGVADTVFFGGWEKGRRLPTAMTYRTDLPAESSAPADVVHSSLPEVAVLSPSVWVPVTGHSGTLVRDKFYVFGGHAWSGCSNDLYALENVRLRATYDAAVQRCIMEDGKRLNATWRSRNSITLGGSSYMVEVRDGLTAVDLSDGGGGEGAGAREAAWRCSLVGGSRHEAICEAARTAPLADVSTGVCAETSRADSHAGTSSRLRGRPGSHHGGDSFTTARPGTGGPPAAPPAAAPPASAPPAPAPPASAPAPPPRSSHCAASMANRFLVFFGGRQLEQPSGGNGPDGQQGASGAKAGASSRARGKSQPKGRSAAATTTGAAAPTEDEAALPTVTLLDDVAAFDTETGVWLQVRVVGAESPCARYGAAMCTLPSAPGPERGRYPPSMALHLLNSPTADAAHAQREVFLHGGIDASGNVLSDAWVLQAMGKPASWLLERDARTGVSVLTVRWVSIRAELTALELLPDLARTREAQEDEPPTEALTTKRKKNGSGAAARSSISAAYKALQAQLAECSVSVLPHRAHHAVVATVNRDIFIIGGESVPIKVSIENDVSGLETPLDCAVNQRGKASLFTVHVPPLDGVKEVVVELSKAKSRTRDKA